MGFSSALQGRAAHEALIARQDAELRLMETMKRSIQMKAKCDKEYAVSLAAVAQQGLKIDRADDLQDSLITKSWRTYMDELDHQAKQFKSNAELLEIVCEKMTHLSQDKRKARKSYQEEHTKIAARLNHLTDEVIRKKAEYQKHLEGYKTLRTRFEEHYIKSGRSGRKLDDVRDKYQKACRKLHLTHNEYVLIIVEAIEVEKDFRTILLPGLLEHQQSVQESFILLWKNILQEAVQHSDLTSDKFKEIQKRIELTINNINPCEEYREFTEKHKTSPTTPVLFQFDEALIEDIPGKLQSNTLTVDNLTVDWLRSRLNELETSVKECQEKQEKLVGDLNGGSAPLLNGLNGMGKEIQKQSKDLNSLRCQEKQKQKLADMIKIALSEVGCEELPSGCDDHLTNVEQNFIENNGFSNEQPANSVIPANSVSMILQRGADVMSMIKSPFKRKTTPQSPVLQTKSRIRCASEGDRSQSMGSLSVNSSNNSHLSVAIDVCPSKESEICENKYLNMEKSKEINIRQSNIYAELDLTSLESKNHEELETFQPIGENLLHKSDDVLLKYANIPTKFDSIPSKSEEILTKTDSIPSKSESFLFRNKNPIDCKESVKNSIDAHLDKIDEINKVMDDKLKQTLSTETIKADKCLEMLKKQENEILKCESPTEPNSISPTATAATTTASNDTQNAANVLDLELQQMIQANFIKPTPKQILMEQKEVEMLAKKLRKKAEEKTKKRSSSFSHKSINNLITNLKEFSFHRNHQTIEEKCNDDDDNENEHRKLKHSVSERIASTFSDNNKNEKAIERKGSKKGLKDKKLVRTPKKSPKSPRGKKSKDHHLKSTFRTKLFRFQMRRTKICEKCSKRQIHPSKSMSDFGKEFHIGSSQSQQQSNEFCVCNDLDSSSNDEPLCIKEHTYCEPFGVSNTVLGFNCILMKRICIA